MDVLQTVGWTAGPLLLERYRYPAGPAVSVPRHAHDDVQICLSLDLTARYWYRGAWHIVPRGGITVIGAGELHAGDDLGHRPDPATYLMMYADPAQLAEVSAAVSAGGAPSFPLCVPDADLFGAFVELHRAHAGPRASRLERDTRTWEVFARLVARHARRRPAVRPVPAAPAALARARDHLLDDVAANVSLADLATVAGLSPFHLSRLFRREFGLPPHAFQVQARVDLARRLLLRGHPPHRAAHEAGFYDESHLHRHFTRIVGVAPGRYRKFVQAPAPPAP